MFLNPFLGLSFVIDLNGHLSSFAYHMDASKDKVLASHMCPPSFGPLIRSPSAGGFVGI